MTELDELSKYWAKRLWEIRPLDDDYRNKMEDEMGLYHPAGFAVHRNTRACFDTSSEEILSFYAPKYTEDFGACLDIIKYLQKQGAWVKINSPFIPSEKDKPINPFYWQQWEETRNHWFVSVDFHGTTDTHPIWQASSENPAWAICDAGRQWLDDLEKGEDCSDGD